MAHPGLPWRALPVLLLLLVVAPGCAENKVPVKIGISSFPAYELVYLAAEMGFFAAAGLDARIVELQSLSDSDRALGLGQIDVAAMPMVNLVVKTARGTIRPLPIWVLDYSAGADMVLARAETPDLAALRGKRIGLEADSLGYQVIDIAARVGGVSMKDFDLITFVDQPEGLDAFVRTEVDAIVTYFPMIEALAGRVEYRQIFDSSQGPREIVDVLAVTEELAASRPEVIPALQEGMRRALQFLADKPAQALSLMAARERVPVADFKAALENGLYLVPAAEQAQFFAPQGGLASILYNHVRLLTSQGLLETQADIDWDRLVSGIATLAPAPEPPL